ncbi:UNVERIFIED_ORG: hypothetical protein J2X79_004639 [Arthrobacter globiformis]|nr:hypothetical protein [Arthrobacter globiformis]
MPLESVDTMGNPTEMAAEASAHPAAATDVLPSKVEDVTASMAPGSAMEFLANFPLYPFL